MAKFIKLECEAGNVYVPENSILYVLENIEKGCFLVMLNQKIISFKTGEKGLEGSDFVAIPKEKASCLDALLS